MREILFRGKRIDNGEWVEGCFLHGDLETGQQGGKNATCFISMGFGNGFWEVQPETVGQYTGLKDRNGNKIFEGDRVVGDVGNGYNPAPRLLRRIGIVEYGNRTPGFSFKIINRFGINENGESDWCDFKNCGVSFGAFGNKEVIGTKFDACYYKKPDGLCLRESDKDNNIYCCEGPCDEIIGNAHDKEE